MLLSRLRRASAEELRWRATTLLRRGAQEASARIRPPRWNRARLGRVLRTEAVDADMRTLIGRRDWPAAHRALLTRIRSRRTRYVLDPASRHAVCSVISSRWPDSAREARNAAERLAAGRYSLLGYSDLSFDNSDGSVDWHADPVHQRRAPLAFYARVPYLDPVVGDHKIIWELNRHQHWLRLGRAAWLTGDGRYGRRVVEELRSWLSANPPLTGINWASMLELGFRALSWTWALHCLAGLGDREHDPEDTWLVDILVGLDAQLTHLERNLSYYFSPNTHLTGEALALYVVGTALPELAGADRWIDTGRAILLREIDRQVLPDGGHAERSTHYQRYTLDFYLLALLTARLAGDDEAARRFADAAARLADFTRVIADSTGTLPLIGDDDGGMLWPLAGRRCDDVRDSLSLAATALAKPELAPWGLTEETVWIGGADAASRAASMPHVSASSPGSRSLVDTGYVVLRTGDGDHGVFDTGRHGYLNGGHAHADALSLTLALRGKPLLVDPGTGSYTADPALRDRMRATSSHNTLTVGGRSSSISSGPFHWRTQTDARLAGSRHNHRFDWAEAWHDGYAPIRHHRAVMRCEGGGWFVADAVTGDSDEMVDLHWHFDSRWNVTQAGTGLHALEPGGGGAWLLHDRTDVTLFQGDRTSGLGWQAPVYGRVVPASATRLRGTGPLPQMFATWIGPDAEWRAPVMHRLPLGEYRVDGRRRPARASRDAAGDPTGSRHDTDSVGVRIIDGDREAVFLVRFTPAIPPPGGLEVCEVGSYRTDARAFHWVADSGRLRSFAAVDVRSIVPSQRGWVGVESDAPIPDLYGSVGAACVELWMSRPTTSMRVTGLVPGQDFFINGVRHDVDVHGACHVSEDAGSTMPFPGASFAEH